MIYTRFKLKSPVKLCAFHTQPPRPVQYQDFFILNYHHDWKRGDKIIFFTRIPFSFFMLKQREGNFFFMGNFWFYFPVDFFPHLWKHMGKKSRNFFPIVWNLVIYFICVCQEIFLSCLNGGKKNSGELFQILFPCVKWSGKNSGELFFLTSDDK